MKQTLNLILFIIVVGTTKAQTIVSGKISNSKSQPIHFASVTIKETGVGVNSDSAGYYKLVISEVGKITLVFSSVGYQAQEKSIAVANTPIHLDIVLRNEAKQLPQVVVSAGSFEASDKAKGASLTPMDAVTVAGTGADLANALRFLPGSQQVGEREGLFVRGGTSEEAKQFVDGTLLKSPNFYSVPGILQPARLNPFLFKGILFNTGAYSALYGDALSSALILETIDLPDQSSASLHIFPMSVGAGYQKLAKNKKASYGVNTSYGNYSPYYKAVKSNVDFFHEPEYLTTDANFRIKTSKTGILKFYVNYGYNHTGLRNPDLDSSNLYSSFENKGTNVYSNLSYRESFENNWKVDAGLAYNYATQRIINRLEDDHGKQVISHEQPFHEKNGNFKINSNFAQARLVLTKKLSRNQAIRFGAEYTEDFYDYNDAYDSAFKVKDHYTAVFAESDIYITQNIAAKAGVRAEHSSALNKTNISPRLSLGYRLNDGSQFNIGYGIFYQKPELIYLWKHNKLDYSRADHYVLNYIKKANNRLLRIEAYYKDYKTLLVTEPHIGNSGEGYAKGIELFFRDKKTFKDFDYWITYTYLDTKRKYQNYPSLLQPTFATPHTASIAIKRFFPEMKFSANLSYAIATGRPYYDIRADETENYKVFNSGKTNMYNQMNLSFAYMFSIFKKWKHPDFSGIGFGINNVFGTKQIFGYKFGHDGLNRTPITQPATRSYYLGLFMSFGIDRRDDFINENL